ncbi:MAG: oligosaccharide repeat unit polymerase [Candidatus Doudnabacteria bacterium]|nr:oligosaccharide repeat unit polymerase [Candidatus Doudnabacteria bacterium]
MLSAWMLGLGIPRLNLSRLEKDWYPEYWLLLFVSLCMFVIGYYLFDKWLGSRFDLEVRDPLPKGRTFSSSGGAGSTTRLRIIIYFLFAVSLIALATFYVRAGNFPLFAKDPDVFRFAADEQVPGLINYSAQLARLFIPLSFYLFFIEGFNWPWRKKTQPRLPLGRPQGNVPTAAYRRRHMHLVFICLIGALSLILFTSRTQIFFVDLWVMALYLLMRRPNLTQALKFYPVFLLISILVLATVPLYRQYKSYGTTDYLAGVASIDSSGFNPAGKALLPIYVGVSFNQQALLHAVEYYEMHPLQHGRVSLDPFTNLFGKAIPALNQFKSDFDLCAIFKCWWNTGTYLFPFVQDFGKWAFVIIPLIIAGILAFVYRYWLAVKNFLSINLYAYACFFVVMSIYLSFTVRAEMYLDLFLLLVIHLFVTRKMLSTDIA